MITRLTFRFFAVAALFVGGLVAIFSGYWIAGVAAHLVLFGVLLVGTLRPNSRLFGPLETNCDGGVWLTIDDGPDLHDTPAILDLLDRHHAKATFFVIGEKAERHPELVREIVRRGHQIGNHTWSHPQATFWCHGPVRTYREIVRCQRALTAILGEPPQVFRAPVGHSNFFVHPVLEKLGLRLVGWSSRGFDGVSTSHADVARRIRASAKEGGIILVHEGTSIAVEVVADVLALAEENGWRLVIPDVSPRSGSC
jgi:peptidoglycan/xylan/chitin deacetylase (PgdA/CDA1 family)